MSTSAARQIPSPTKGQRLLPVDIGTLPQPWDTIGRHAALPDLAHDERARLDAHAHLNFFLSQAVVPAMRAAYDASGATPGTRDEARAVLEGNPVYRAWSRLRRGSMEHRQQFVTAMVDRTRPAHARACAEQLAAARNLELDPTLKLPPYLTQIHAHLMPGGYVSENVPDDAGAGAAYELGLYSTVGGRSGPWSDGGGRAIANWLRTRYPDFRPKRIFDLGCGAGLNTVAVAQAFPDAEIIAIDAGAPMLRYAAARAHALGITNVRFVQADIENIPARLGNADFIFTAIVLHETSREALRAIFRGCRARLRPGGLTIHMEQPPYDGKPLFEQVLRDWDGHYNNECFWSELYAMDLRSELVAAGFSDNQVFEDSVTAVPWRTDASTAGKLEDYGRTGNWIVFGAFNP